MNKNIQRLLSGLLALCMLLCLSACGGDTDNNEDTPVSPTKKPSTTVTTTTTAPELPPNPLTGVKDFDTDNNRPVAFAVPDEDADIIQVGIEHADMYFEAETEAGIPRLLAIFASADNLPDSVGPVRSARPHFIKYVNALDAIYCHIGGSGDAREAIRNQKIADIESASVVDPILTQAVRDGNNVSWNNKAFTKEKVLSAIDRLDYRTTTNTESPYTFEKKEGNLAANALDVKISRTYNIGFTYDSATGQYIKHRVTTRGDGLAMDQHKTGTGGTIAVSNVIVMFDKRTVLDYKNGGEYHVDFELKSGAGLLACGGTARKIVWKRTDEQLSFYEEDGVTPLHVAEGKTFVCLTDKNLESKTLLK